MSCGPACCRQLLLDRGIDVAEEKLRIDAYCDTIVGSGASELADALNTAVGADEYKGGSLENLSDLPKLMRCAPFLALLKLGSRHWVIVDGQNSLFVQIRDPAGMPKDLSVGAEATMRIEQFHRYWTLGLHAVVFRK